MRWGLTPEAHSTGSADVEQMLGNTYGSLWLSRSVQSRAPSSIEHDLREYAECTKEHTQATLDLNLKALGLLMKSMENMQQARTQAIHAQQHFEDLLSVSPCHCECVCSRQCTENESIEHITCEACDQHHRQADYECHLRSNVLTANERQDIKPPPVSSILLESRSMSVLLSHNADGDMSSQDIGASVEQPPLNP